MSAVVALGLLVAPAVAVKVIMFSLMLLVLGISLVSVVVWGRKGAYVLLMLL